MEIEKEMPTVINYVTCRKKFLWLPIVVVLFLTLLSIALSASPVQASDHLHPQEQAQAHNVIGYFKGCQKRSDVAWRGQESASSDAEEALSQPELENGTVFAKYSAGFDDITTVGTGYLIAQSVPGAAKNYSCIEDGNPGNILGAVGIEPFQFFTEDTGIYESGEAGYVLNEEYDDDDRNDRIRSVMNSKFKSGMDEARYFQLRAAFHEVCRVEGDPGEGSGREVATVDNDTGEVSSERYFVNDEEPIIGHGFQDVEGASWNGGGWNINAESYEMECDDIVNNMDNFAPAAGDAISTWAAANPDEEPPGDEGAEGSGESRQEECEAEGLTGFLACDMMLVLLDWIQELQVVLVETLFEPDTMILGDDEDPRLAVWSNVRDIANGLLVVAFLVVIFSLAFSVNVDAYTIKRLMPKLLIAAVAIQASYLISAVMVDASIVLGQGLQGLTEQIMENVVENGNRQWGDEIEAAGGDKGTGYSMAGVYTIGIWGALAGGLLVAPHLGALFLLFLLVVFGAFLIVALREVFIFLFAVLSPIFFLANLLPATEKWFKFWWSNFSRLLMMYPFMILMIQIANIAAIASLAGTSPEDTNTFEALVTPFLALVIQLAGIISIYFAFRLGGTVMSMATKGVTKMGKKGGGDRLTGKFKQGVSETSKAYGAGAKGKGWNGKVRQAITSPLSTTGRSRVPVIGNKSAATASGQFNQAVAEQEKDFQAKNLDPDGAGAAEFAEHGSNTLSFNNRLQELYRSDDASDTDKAEKMKQYSDRVGNSAAQVAAAKKAASAGKLEDNGFQSLNQQLGNNPAMQQQVMGDLAKASADAGRPDLEAKYHPKYKKDQDMSAVDEGGNRLHSAAAGKAVQSLDAKQLASLKPDALRDKRTGEATDFGNAVADQLRRDPAFRQTAGASLSSHMGMPAETRKAFENIAGPDTVQTIQQEASQPHGGGPQGGGGAPSGGGGPQQPSPPRPPQPPSSGDSGNSRIVQPGDSDFNIPPESRPPGPS